MILNERLFENTSSNEDKKFNEEFDAYGDWFYTYQALKNVGSVQDYSEEFEFEDEAINFAKDHDYDRVVRYYYPIIDNSEETWDFIDYVNYGHPKYNEEIWNRADNLDEAYKKKVKESIDYTDENYLYKPYWYLTKHGMGPGSVPARISIWTWFETPEGTYFASSNVISTRELKEYEIVEKHPNLEDIPEKSRVDIQNFLEAPITDADKNIVAKENLNIKEDIEKTKSGKWVNRGKEGTHGEFKTKKAAREQQKAMFARGFKESVKPTNAEKIYDKLQKDLNKLGYQIGLNRRTGDIQINQRVFKENGRYKSGTITTKEALKDAIDLANEYGLKTSVEVFLHKPILTIHTTELFNPEVTREALNNNLKVKYESTVKTSKNTLNAIKDDIKESFKVVDKNGKKVPQGGGFTSRKEAEMFAAQYGEKDLRVVKESLDGIEDIGESKFGTKEYKYKKYTIEYFPIDAYMDGMEPQHIESYIIKSPAVLTNSGYHLPLYCEDEKGNEVNFRSLQQVKDWIDKFDGKFKLQWKHGDELHAVIKDEFLDESLYQTDSVSGNKMTFEVTDDGKFIVKDGEKVILNTKVVDVQDTKNQIKSMQDIEILREGYTPKQQRVLDAFYKDMNFGFDSNRVIINKVTDNTVEFTLDGISDIYKLIKESKIEDLNENLDDEVAKEVEMIFSSADETFPSRMLSRLKSDFKYILGAVKDNAEKNNESVSLNTINKHLWFHDIDKQAALMKEIYERLDEKPEDLTLQDIDNFVTETKQLLNKKKAIEEDLEREIEDLNENPGDEEEIDPTAGLETVLNDLINDENEAINGYNSAIVNFEVEGRGDLTQVFRDIIKDEQNHIGNLQKVLNEINPDTLKNIQDGQKEAEETLQSDSTLETEETNE